MEGDLKMTSKNRRKGNTNRLKAIKELEADGWLVDTVEKTNRWAKQRDLFNIADLCCIKKGIIKFVQVTTNQPHNHKIFEEFSKKYCDEKIKLEQWVWHDYKGFKKHEYKNEP
jgi:hypothetical protein